MKLGRRGFLRALFGAASAPVAAKLLPVATVAAAPVTFKGCPLVTVDHLDVVARLERAFWKAPVVGADVMPFGISYWLEPRS